MKCDQSTSRSKSLMRFGTLSVFLGVISGVWSAGNLVGGDPGICDQEPKPDWNQGWWDSWQKHCNTTTTTTTTPLTNTSTTVSSTSTATTSTRTTVPNVDGSTTTATTTRSNTTATTPLANTTTTRIPSTPKHDTPQGFDMSTRTTTTTTNTKIVDTISVTTMSSPHTQTVSTSGSAPNSQPDTTPVKKTSAHTTGTTTDAAQHTSSTKTTTTDAAKHTSSTKTTTTDAAQHTSSTKTTTTDAAQHKDTASSNKPPMMHILAGVCVLLVVCGLCLVVVLGGYKRFNSKRYKIVRSGHQVELEMANVYEEENFGGTKEEETNDVEESATSQARPKSLVDESKDVKRLLACPGPNVVDAHGRNLLHIAVSWTTKENLKETIAVVKELVARGENIQQSDREDSTPVHYAIRMGHESLVQCLFKQGASHLAVDRTRMTVLMMAAAYNHVGMIKIILTRSGRNRRFLTAQDAKGRTALHWAMQSQAFEAVEVLCCRPGQDLSLQDSDGDTILHLGIRTASIRVTKRFIELVKPKTLRKLCNIRNVDGFLPAQIAEGLPLMNRSEEVAEFSKFLLEVFSKLLESKGASGSSPRNSCQATGDNEMIVDGASTKLVSSPGSSPPSVVSSPPGSSMPMDLNTTGSNGGSYHCQPPTNPYDVPMRTTFVQPLSLSPPMSSSSSDESLYLICESSEDSGEEMMTNRKRKMSNRSTGHRTTHHSPDFRDGNKRNPVRKRRSQEDPDVEHMEKMVVSQQARKNTLFKELQGLTQEAASLRAETWLSVPTHDLDPRSTLDSLLMPSHEQHSTFGSKSTDGVFKVHPENDCKYDLGPGTSDLLFAEVLPSSNEDLSTYNMGEFQV